MTQEFYINQNSELPTLRMEIIYDGRSDYDKFFEAVQNADISFTMTNVDNGMVRVGNQPAYIKLKDDGGCRDKYVVCYDWKKRDTREIGRFRGQFTITFGDDLKSDADTYPSGDLIMPIREELMINVI